MTSLNNQATNASTVTLAAHIPANQASRVQSEPGLVIEHRPVGTELVRQTIPETTPMAQLFAKIFSQYR